MWRDIDGLAVSDADVQSEADRRLAKRREAPPSFARWDDDPPESACEECGDIDCAACDACGEPECTCGGCDE